MTAGMVDVLGFRFYWATKDLTEKGLAYKLNPDGRFTEEIINPINSKFNHFTGKVRD